MSGNEKVTVTTEPSRPGAGAASIPATPPPAREPEPIPAPIAGEPLTRPRSVRVLGLLAALALLVVALGLSLGLGLKDIPVGETFAAIWRDDGSTHAATIRGARFPRAVLAMLVGAALGIAGTVMQALTRNPLADPGLLGVTMGASTSVVFGIAFFGVTNVLGHVWLGMLGAALAAAAVYLLGAQRQATPDRLVLSGAAISAILVAVNAAILLLDPLAFNQWRFWNVGSLAGRAEIVGTIAPILGPAIVVALFLGRPLNALALGDDAGRGLGANVTLVRVAGGAAITVLCGAATAAVGPLVFVGLVVPLIARVIAGPDLRWTLAYSVVLAPVLLLLADVLSRVVVEPGELQVGIVTAVVGAPVFIAMCVRGKVGRW